MAANSPCRNMPKESRSMRTFVILLALLFPLKNAVSQAPAASSGANSTATTSVSENAYFAGGNLRISNPVAADLVATGGRVSVEAQVAADAALAGGTVEVRAPVHEDVRVAGGTVTVARDIGGDLVAAGGSVQVENTVRIGGDAWLAGSEVRLGGRVGNGVRIYGNRIVVAADIAGDARLSGQDIELAPEARIGGNLYYASPSAPRGLRPEQVGGNITRLDSTSEQEDYRANGPGLSWLHPIFMLSMLVFGIILYLLFPRAVAGTARTLGAHPWRSLAVGFALLFTIPPLAIFLMVTVIGIPIGLALMLLYPLVLLLGYLSTAFFLGGRAAHTVSKGAAISSGKQVLFLALALLALSLLLAIPFVGPFVFILATIAGTGSLVTWVFLRSRAPENRMPSSV